MSVVSFGHLPPFMSLALLSEACRVHCTAGEAERELFLFSCFCTTVFVVVTLFSDHRCRCGVLDDWLGRQAVSVFVLVLPLCRSPLALSELLKPPLVNYPQERRSVSFCFRRLSFSCFSLH